jgi:hypothetical protein
MKWFSNRKQAQEGEERLPGPKGIPIPVGTYMVVEMKQDPKWVWQLTGVVRPAGEREAFYCRVFSDPQVTQAGLKVKDWTSLDGHPELILWEGYFEKKTNTVRQEKSVKRSNSPN